MITTTAVHEMVMTLCSNSARLRALQLLPKPRVGSSSATAEEVRFGRTWHPRAMTPHWARSIGGWGAVEPFGPILERCGGEASRGALKVFMHRFHLAAAPDPNPGRGRRRVGVRIPQHELASRAYARWLSRDVRAPWEQVVPAIAWDLRVLPVELRYYVDAVAEILIAEGIDLEGVPEDEMLVVVNTFVQPHWGHYSKLLSDVVQCYSEA